MGDYNNILSLIFPTCNPDKSFMNANAGLAFVYFENVHDACFMKHWFDQSRMLKVRDEDEYKRVRKFLKRHPGIMVGKSFPTWVAFFPNEVALPRKFSLFRFHTIFTKYLGVDDDNHVCQ